MHLEQEGLLLELEIEEALVDVLVDALEFGLDILSLKIQILLTVDHPVEILKLLVYLLLLLEMLLHSVIQNSLILTHLVFFEVRRRAIFLFLFH